MTTNTSKERKEIYVYCDVQAVELLANYGVKPIAVSKILWSDFWNTHMIASYPSFEPLEKIPDKRWTQGWWRSVGRANISVDDEEGFYGKGYKPKIARKVGLLTYICDQYGASTEKNVAAVIGELAHHEGKTPIDYFNTFSKL